MKNVYAALFNGLILMALAACAGADPLLVAKQTPAAGKRVLFVGNSYLYYGDSLHNHVRRLAEELGPYKEGDYRYKSATIGGAKLSHHNLSSLLTPGQLGLDETFEWIVLQPGSSETLSVQSRRHLKQSAAAAVELAHQHRARVALYMTPAYVSPHTNVQPEQIRVISRAYADLASELEVEVIPVGLAFDLAYQERPDIVLHKPFDGSHPSLLGTYLAACVTYQTLYKRDVTDATYSYFDSIPPDAAAFLRRVASRTVKTYAP